MGRCLGHLGLAVGRQCWPRSMSPLPFLQLGYFSIWGLVFFSIFMSLWATGFLEHRKCKSITLVHHWDRSDFQEEEVRPSSARQAQNSISQSSHKPQGMLGRD